ncbi:MAG: hypothetical protein JXQ27_09015 [Acidobacteria bacterium]|nr:hypothetical protein [Acidobacteriota bacterium]
MTNECKIITRRDFMVAGSFAVGGAMARPSLGQAPPTVQTDRSRVVLIRDKNVLDENGQVRKEVIARMLDDAIKALFNTGDALAPWRNLFKSSDIVGIKTNVWTPLPTPRALEETIQERLVAVGVDATNIGIKDRGLLQDPIFTRSTALVNVRPMRTHHWSGLGTLIKNHIMFTDQPWAYHGNACERLGAVWELPMVKGKTRLNILVMLTPLFHGVGPHHFSAAYTWPYYGLIVSTDPVAADTTGARIIEAKRRQHFGEDRPISPPPRHIAAADTQFGLGQSRPERIDLITLGFTEDLLLA